jgi:putative ABC transport system permease protein
VPIVISLGSIEVAVISLLLIGPFGGLVSLIVLLRVEPLTALGLTA